MGDEGAEGTDVVGDKNGGWPGWGWEGSLSGRLDAEKSFFVKFWKALGDEVNLVLGDNGGELTYWFPMN